MDPVTPFWRMSNVVGYEVVRLEHVDIVAHYSNAYGIPLMSKHLTIPVLAQRVKDDVVIELHPRFIMRYLHRNYGSTEEKRKRSWFTFVCSNGRVYNLTSLQKMPSESPPSFQVGKSIHARLLLHRLVLVHWFI